MTIAAEYERWNGVMKLRDATSDDLDFIVAQESRPEVVEFICRWGRERHGGNLADPDKRYLIAEAEAGRPLGYVILAGLAGENGSLELVRILMVEPGRGAGQGVLQEVMALAFEEHGAHRLWLDVFPENARGRHVYRKLGFVEEGVLRDALRFDGGYRSLVVMSILEEEYRRRRTGARAP